MKIVYDLIKDSIEDLGYTKHFQDMPLVQLNTPKETTVVYTTKDDAITYTEIGNTVSIYGEQTYIVYIITDDLYYDESQDGTLTTRLLALYRKIASKIPYSVTDTNGEHRVFSVTNPTTTFSGKTEKGARVAELTFKVYWIYKYG